jgi:hypothetical protein
MFINTQYPKLRLQTAKEINLKIITASSRSDQKKDKLIKIWPNFASAKFFLISLFVGASGP